MNSSILEQTKAQAQVLIPVFEELKAEMGEEKAQAIMHRALEKWGKNAGRQIKDMIPGNPADKIAAATSYYSMDHAIEYEIIQQTSEAFEYKVTGCKYAEFYKELGQAELGYRFVCAHDFSIASGISPDLELERKGTIMQGDPQCHFLYKLKK